MLTYWLTLIICFNDLCFLITKCKLKINTGKGQHNCHQDRCWDNLHEIDPHQSKMCRRNKLMVSWQFFFQLAPCVLLPSFPTYKQNTAIHQHGRNCSQPCKASPRVLCQMIRTCLHSLRMPHVRGTDTLPTGHTVPSHGPREGSGSQHRDLTPIHFCPEPGIHPARSVRRDPNPCSMRDLTLH